MVTYVLISSLMASAGITSGPVTFPISVFVGMSQLIGRSVLAGCMSGQYWLAVCPEVYQVSLFYAS